MSNDELIITPLEQNSDREIAAEFHSLDEDIQIFLQSPDISLVNHPEVWLCFSLPPAIRKGTVLNIQAPISQRFFEAMPMVQDIYTSWFPTWKRVEIRGVRPILRAPASEGRVGCFFSGGVDSWYTFLKHREQITDLIFVHGFDIQLDETFLYQRSHDMVKQVAIHFNKRMIEVKTNLRAFTNRHIEWSNVLGSALASVGLALSDHFRKIYIASAHTYVDMIPSGTHPLLDSLWSTEGLDFVHDGCEATRMAKVQLLSGYDIALQTLRVCWKNPDGVYNCGKCEKCLRTMIELQAAGVLERCPTFDIPLDLRRVARMPIRDENARHFAEENLHALEVQPKHRELVSALRHALARSRWETPLKKALAQRKRQGRENHPRLYNMAKHLYFMLKSRTKPPPSYWHGRDHRPQGNSGNNDSE